MFAESAFGVNRKRFRVNASLAAILHISMVDGKFYPTVDVGCTKARKHEFKIFSYLAPTDRQVNTHLRKDGSPTPVVSKPPSTEMHCPVM